MKPKKSNRLTVSTPLFAILALSFVVNATTQIPKNRQLVGPASRIPVSLEKKTFTNPQKADLNHAIFIGDGQSIAAAATACQQYANLCAAQAKDRVLVCALAAFNGNSLIPSCRDEAAYAPYANCNSMASACSLASSQVFYSSQSTAAIGITYSNSTTSRAECPSGQFAQGMQVRWGDWPGGPKDYRLVQSVRLYCTTGVGVALADQRTVHAAFGQYSQDFECNAGQLLSGATVWGGSHVDAIQPKCRQVASLDATPTTKTGSKMGGPGGGPISLDCTSGPGRYVYGMVVSYDGDNSGVESIHRVINSIQFLCR